MTDRTPTTDRRKFLRSSATAVLGFAAGFEVVAEPTEASAGPSSHERRDLAVINNDDEPRDVVVEILDSPRANEPLYARRIHLRGLNEPGSGFESRTRFDGAVSARAPSGTYTVRASLADGDSAEFEVPLGPDGPPDAFGFSVYVHPVDGLRTHAGWD